MACDGVKIWLENTGVCLVTYLFISLLAIYIIILGILQIKNLSAMEVNIVRPFIGRALQAFYKHDSSDLIPDPERVSDRRPQVAHNAPRVCLFDTLLRNVSCTNKINRLLICYVLFVRVYQLYVDSLNMFYTDVQSYLTVLSCQNVFFVENGKL